MSEPRKSCAICKDPIEDNQTWTVETAGVVHNDCHLKQKLVQSDDEITRLKSELEKCRVTIDLIRRDCHLNGTTDVELVQQIRDVGGSWLKREKMLESRLHTSEQRVKELEVAMDRIVKYPVHSEPVGGAYEMQDIASNALATLHKAIGEVGS